MKELALIIHNETGLHARPAKALSKLAKKYSSKISIKYDGKEGNAKSMISILKLGVKQSAEIQLVVDGDDEADAAQKLAEAIRSGLGETLPATAQATNGHEGGASTSVPEAVKSEPVPQEATAENMLRGLPASTGVGIAPIFHLKAEEVKLLDRFLGIDQELATLDDAIASAIKEVNALQQKMVEAGKEEEGEIFAAHQEIIEDPALREGVESDIRGGQNSSRSWWGRIEEEAAKLAALDDELLAARSADVRDVGQRVLRLLTGQAAVAERPTTPYILAAVDLTPSDTASLDPELVLGLATSEGGPTAHSAIIARSLGLPAVVGLGEPLEKVADGTTVVVDGETGTVLVDPTPEQLSAAEAKQKRNRAAEELALQKAHLPAQLAEGKVIEIAANAGSIADAEAAYEAGADGIGLLRTEFLFLGRETAPTIDDQQAIYSGILGAMKDRPVIFRTLDIGGDKPVPYIEVAPEENPFLGERGIRLQLNRPELLRDQFRALYKSAGNSKVRIMLPMVGRVAEFKAARQIADEIRAEVGGPAIELGMMIEVPSAAVMADQFAPYIDFFSIGTNDLTQYTLAVDRQHPTLTAHADGLDPAVLRLIKMTVDGAKTHGRWVGICGELGSDVKAVPILLGLGLDELSVNLKAIARVKAQVRELSLSECQRLAYKALACESAAEVRSL